MEYTSYQISQKVNITLGLYYAFNFHKKTSKCWRYPTSSNGGHASSPYIDDYNCDDDPFDKYDDTICAFNWDELQKIMNHKVLGCYRKSEFEAIENIDDYAMQLNDYINENK